MKQNILSRGRNTMVSITADETSDCSHCEQLSVCVYYFNIKENRPIKQFIINSKLTSFKTLSTIRWSRRSEVIETLKNDDSALLLYRTFPTKHMYLKLAPKLEFIFLNENLWFYFSIA